MKGAFWVCTWNIFLKGVRFVGWGYGWWIPKWSSHHEDHSLEISGTSCDVTACKFCDYPTETGHAHCKVCFVTQQNLEVFVKHSRISCHTILIHIKHHTSLYSESSSGWSSWSFVASMQILCCTGRLWAGGTCRWNSRRLGCSQIPCCDWTVTVCWIDLICSPKIKWVSFPMLVSVSVSGSNLWVSPISKPLLYLGTCATLHDPVGFRGMRGLGTECHHCGGLWINVCH